MVVRCVKLMMIFRALGGWEDNVLWDALGFRSHLYKVMHIILPSISNQSSVLSVRCNRAIHSSIARI